MRMRPEKRQKVRPATPLQVRHGFARIDTDPTQRRAECDPSIPIGQDEQPKQPAQLAQRLARLGRKVQDRLWRHFGLVTLVVAVLAVVGAMLTAHVLAGRAEPAQPSKAVRPVKVLT